MFKFTVTVQVIATEKRTEYVSRDAALRLADLPKESTDQDILEALGEGVGRESLVDYVQLYGAAELQSRTIDHVRVLDVTAEEY